jgi:glycosyltransferase involved in cell wall biosynthesis
MGGTICLNMIVKNEGHVIRRCLESVKRLIDYWVIVDTGSSDGTREIVRESLKDIPGELHERPWVNFGHNRNEALALARGREDYLLFIDADDRCTFTEDFKTSCLDKDIYYIKQELKHQAVAEFDYANNYVVFLVKNHEDFYWEGVLHEALYWNSKKSHGILTGAVIEYFHDGSRSKDPMIYDRDIEMLEEAIQKDPKNSRNVFYLAQTYWGAKDYQKAVGFYEKRTTMGGREDEIFYSLLALGLRKLDLGVPTDEVVKALCKAYQYRPIRAEPLFALIELCIKEGDDFLGYLIAEFALSLPMPVDLFVVPWVYEWGIKQQLDQCNKKLSALIFLNKYDELAAS